MAISISEEDIKLLELRRYPPEEIMKLIENDIFEETVNEIKSILMLKM